MDVFIPLHCTKKSRCIKNFFLFAEVNLTSHFFSAQENVLVPNSYPSEIRVVSYGSAFGKNGSSVYTCVNCYCSFISVHVMILYDFFLQKLNVICTYLLVVNLGLGIL